jgi:hypothetical protein
MIPILVSNLANSPSDLCRRGAQKRNGDCGSRDRKALAYLQQPQ